jgi:hypothetical protein
MSTKLETCEKLFAEKHLAYRADHVPCTVKNTYFNPDNNNDDGTLIRRELILLENGTEKVIFGIEYDDKGHPAEAYTTDSKGKRIKLVTEAKEQSNTLPNLISERLSKARNLTNAKELPTVTKEPATAPKRSIKKTVRKPLTSEHEL